MKVKYLDKNFKKFLLLSGTVIIFSSLLLAVLVMIYYSSSIFTYNIMTLLLMIVIILMIIFFSLSFLTIFYVYKNKEVKSKFILNVSKIGIKILLPIIMALANLFKINKSVVRRFYVDFNNITVSTIRKKYKKEDVIVLLPHCLQNADCNFKITNDISNCKECGKCTIGDISRVTREKGVECFVVTGGTAARNIVKKLRPKMILSVACERDLTSGIIDVGNIPVIGIVNERPHGPCYNTCVNVNLLKEKLDSIIK
ncbi:MAG TPA: DUF116 domain-containing protein [Clostridium sp.]|nr:DUF116 domain-containing protein [Clostridium sp.]